MAVAPAAHAPVARSPIFMQQAFTDRAVRAAIHGTRSARPATLLVLLATVAGGCQSYQAKPLDMPELRAAFLARTPESPAVRAFAESLTPREAEGATFDPADGVSCAEAEVVALVFNADLRVARLRAGVSQATADTAGLWEDPTLGVDLARIIDSTPEPWKAFGSLSLTIPISGRLAIAKQQAGAAHAAELARVAQQEWAVRMELRRAWTNWSALAAQHAATRDVGTRADEVVALVDVMERSGEIARTQGRLFRIEQATKAADLATLASRVEESELRLKRLMGLAPDALVTFQASGIGPPPTNNLQSASDAGTRADPEAPAVAIEHSNPALRVARAEYAAAEKALELAIRAQYPDLVIGPGFGREDGMDQVLLGLSVPLPILNANRGAIAEARAQRDVAHATVEAALEGALADVHAADVRRAAATARREALETTIVPLVEAQYADARELARLGEVNTLVLLESITRQHEAQLALIDARREEALAWIDLAEVLGDPDEVDANPHPTSAPAAIAHPASSDTNP